MTSQKILILIATILFLSGCGETKMKTFENEKGGTTFIQEKDGIELTAEMDKKRYKTMDKITINIMAKNISGENIEYTGRDSCDNGFEYTQSDPLERLYDSKKNGSTGGACLMVISERMLDKDGEIKMKLEFVPEKYVVDRHLYPTEELEVDVNFLGTSITLPLLVEIETKKKKEGLPETAEEAARYHLKNEEIKEWMEKDPLNRKKLEIYSAEESGDVWLVQYTTNGPNSQKIEMRIESATGKIIEATGQMWNAEVVIIPQMVIRTAFENELKEKPEKIYKVTAQSNDLNEKVYDENTSDIEIIKNQEHIKTIESYNGEIIEYSRWIYTYTFKMKGKDILEMANSGEWEYIQPGGMLE